MIPEKEGGTFGQGEYQGWDEEAPMDKNEIKFFLIKITFNECYTCTYIHIYVHINLNLEFAYVRQQTVFVFLGLAYFAKCNDLQFHPLSCKWHNLSSLWLTILFSLFIQLWHQGWLCNSAIVNSMACNHLWVSPFRYTPRSCGVGAQDSSLLHVLRKPCWCP